ncbi:hypothetical protein E2I00_015241, partial [Balaenoptera physalus]
KPPASKVLLDNTVPLTAAIEANQSLQSHMEYIIWKIAEIVRRYSDFDLLNNSLQIAGLSLPLPPKKLIGNMDREFIGGRQKVLQNYLNIITTNHILSNSNKSSALLIRMFNEQGTLKDLIYKVKPKDPFLRDYCNPKKIQGLELQQIKTYRQQVLEVLKFLLDKGFPYGHLHASNVLLEGDTCQLLDLENSLKINTLESVDVHCFGHLLYEMTTARLDSFSPALSMAVVAMLESTLSCEACKDGRSTVSWLLQMPLFCDVLLTTSKKPQFKIPTKLKEASSIAKECIEKRLIDEQKQVHQHQRLMRPQSHHGSEEERKQRKIIA